MRHIQGMAVYREVVKGKKRQPVTVVVVAHSEDGFSTILYENGTQKRVSTKFLTMIEGLDKEK